MNPDLQKVITYLKTQRGVDFSGYRPEMIQRRIMLRLEAISTADPLAYLDYIQRTPEELGRLVQCLTIQVSHFFRDPLVFEYLSQKVLPRLIQQKVQDNDGSIRIWSAGCAYGEEPYSLAILLHELLDTSQTSFYPMVFATDIGEQALQQARKGVYPLERLGQVKLDLWLRYFQPLQGKWEGPGLEDNQKLFEIKGKIKGCVLFSAYDLLDSKSRFPPESLFGSFDLILCRNVLMYFQRKQQMHILSKLEAALNRQGLLVLGEAESVPRPFQDRWIQENTCCRIYQKR